MIILFSWIESVDVIPDISLSNFVADTPYPNSASLSSKSFISFLNQYTFTSIPTGVYKDTKFQS